MTNGHIFDFGYGYLYYLLLLIIPCGNYFSEKEVILNNGFFIINLPYVTTVCIAYNPKKFVTTCSMIYSVFSSYNTHDTYSFQVL